MPAIGARTTGVSTVSDPRVSVVGRAGTGPLSEVGPAPGKSALAVLLLRPGRLGDLADPGDRVEGRARPEARRHQLPALRYQVGQAGPGLVTGRERRRQRGARAGLEAGLEGARLDEGVGVVEDVERDVAAAEVLLAEVLDLDRHVVERRG